MVKLLNISIENKQSCFDYVAHISEHATHIAAIVFVEPTGLVSFHAPTREQLERGLERVFNAQPLTYDYVKAGWVIHQRKSLAIAEWDVSKIDVIEFWDDKVLNALKRERVADPQTFLDLLTNLEHDEAVYLRLNDSLLDRKWRDSFLVKLQSIKCLTNEKFLLTAVDGESAEYNQQLDNAVDTNELCIAQTWIVDSAQLLEDAGFTFFTNDTFDGIKADYEQYKVYKEQLNFEEYLHRKTSL